MKKLGLLVLATALLARTPDSSSATHAANRSASNSIQNAAVSATPASNPPEINVVVNQSVVLEEPMGIRRISIASGDIAEAVAASAQEILVNGKAPGDTTLLVWDAKGNRQTYKVHVRANDTSVEGIRRELATEAGPNVTVDVQGLNVFLRGTVKDAITADRAAAIAATLGKVVNLLQVVVPPSDPQILIKVRFADIDRSAALQAGFNLFAVDPYKGLGTSTTGQFGSVPTPSISQQGGQNSVTWSLSNMMNLFYFNPEINVGALLQDLQARNVLQILAEPDLLTLSGKPASFLAGGEFPFPTLQGGGNGVGQITIQFKEFGIRLNFLPTVTPRGTIHLVVTPEVSSLDYSNGLTVSGFTVPGLDTRRVQTEVELQDGQSFVIAGLLDNQTTEELDKMPGIGSIPILGKLFQSKSYTRSKTELLVTVTPQLVRPIPAGVKPPELKFPAQFYQANSKTPPQNPGPEVTGAAAPIPKPSTLPIEELRNWTGSGETTAPAGAVPANAVPAPAPFAPAPQSSPNSQPPQPPPSAAPGSQSTVPNK